MLGTQSDKPSECLLSYPALLAKLVYVHHITLSVIAVPWTLLLLGEESFFFFSWICKRVVYHYIKRRRRAKRPYNTHQHTLHYTTQHQHNTYTDTPTQLLKHNHPWNQRKTRPPPLLGVCYPMVRTTSRPLKPLAPTIIQKTASSSAMVSTRSNLGDIPLNTTSFLSF